MQSVSRDDGVIQREFGVQPLAKIMADNGITPHGLVEASNGALTHKMVSRASKGRRLTRNVKYKILSALNNAVSSQTFKVEDLFNYR